MEEMSIMGLINKQQEYQDQETWSNDIQKAKGYKELKDKVEYWAKQKDAIGNSVINGSCEIVFDNELGWCVDVDSGVSFFGLNIEEIPIQFRNVSGGFWCRNCKDLTSLKGCPIHVGNNFSCSKSNNLTSLEYCPKEVGDSFCCDKKFKIKYVKSLCRVKKHIYTS